MTIKMLVNAVSPLQIKRNSAYLKLQGKRGLEVGYVAGVIVRCWVSFFYAVSVSSVISGLLVSAKWGVIYADLAGFCVGFCVVLLAVVALRNWFSGLFFVVFVALIGMLFSISSLDTIAVENIKYFFITFLLANAGYTLPLSVMQFSVFKRRAVESSVKAFDVSYASRYPEGDEDEAIHEAMWGERFDDLMLMAPKNY